ncbi:hypothetical protein [Algoriphagus sp.]|uniref:hypothetical protein n=1 Tax=Algoriphagus sp. TaxID=1872435 RepID=UPI0027291331|nr:hypothetical protein [Algoriphagus sp.]MDO8967518.1 hypothetical protein [Algoriphagus sp.]MDP3201828.1 hypothetical protein [Algoriphagus sp.]
MKTALLLVLLIVAPFWAYTQSSCDPDQYTLVWSKATDFYERYGPNQVNKQLTANFDSKKMQPRMGTALIWLQRKTQGLAGAKSASSYQNFYPGNSHPDALYTNAWYQATGRLGYYYLRTSSHYLTCVDNSPIEIPGPAWIDIQFNYFNQFAKPVQTTDKEGVIVPVQMDGRPVFSVPEKHSSNGRIDYYEFPGEVPDYVVDYSRMWFYHAFVVRNSDKPLFISVTQRDYLNYYLKQMERFYLDFKKILGQSAPTNSLQDILAEKDERIAEIKRLTEEGAYGYSKDNLANRLQKAEEFYQTKLEEEKNKTSGGNSEVDQEYQESVRLIKDYLNSEPESILSKPIGEIETNPTHEISLTASVLEKLKAPKPERGWSKNTQFAFINPEYFDKSLAPDVPQFIAVEITNNENRHKHLNELAYRLRKDWDFAELLQLLGNTGPQTFLATAEAKPKGGDNFLDKLDELPALGFVLPPLSMPMGGMLGDVFPKRSYSSQKLTIQFPERSPALDALPKVQTQAEYIKYLESLKTSVEGAMSGQSLSASDNLVKTQKISTSEDYSRNAIGVWFSGNPSIALQLHSKASLVDPENGLSANNFAVHLQKSGYPEKALPILNYWLNRYPENSLVLGNAASAYYFLGDIQSAMKLAQKTVELDSLHPNANKILAFGHYRAGNKKLCAGALGRSLKSSYDEEAVALLQEVDPDWDISDLIYEGRKKKSALKLFDEFRLPAPISSLDEAEDQAETIEKALSTIAGTLEGIQRQKEKNEQDPTKAPFDLSVIAQAVMNQGSFTELQLLAQTVVTESWNKYHKQYGEEGQYLEKKIKEQYSKYTIALGEIIKKRNNAMDMLEGGTPEEEVKLMQIQKEACLDQNKALESFYSATHQIIGQFASRMELISREHYNTLAYWMPIWMQSTEAADVLGLQQSYLQDMRNILVQYPIYFPQDCDIFSTDEEEEILGPLMVWEDKFCPIKFVVGMGVAKAGLTCNTISISAGEGIQGEIEFKLNENWDSVEEITVGGGIGASWNLGARGIFEVEAGVSNKGYLKFGRNSATKEWMYTPIDIGAKTEINAVGKVATKYEFEVKVVEMAIGLRSGVKADGLIAQLPVLK